MEGKCKGRQGDRGVGIYLMLSRFLGVSWRRRICSICYSICKSIYIGSELCPSYHKHNYNSGLLLSSCIYHLRKELHGNMMRRFYMFRIRGIIDSSFFTYIFNSWPIAPVFCMPSFCRNPHNTITLPLINDVVDCP